MDNGRIVFDNVRVPRANLLNRYADVAEDGTYSSPIENENKRFFTMLGTLIRGRVSVAATSGAAARKALTIASRYALVRKQFDTPDSDDEVIIADYLVHQRKLLPLIARSYALAFAQNELTEELHQVQTADEVDADRQRQLESAAAGLKAMTSWHAQHAITVCRRRAVAPGTSTPTSSPSCDAISMCSPPSRATTRCSPSWWPRSCYRRTQKMYAASMPLVGLDLSREWPVT